MTLIMTIMEGYSIDQQPVRILEDLKEEEEDDLDEESLNDEISSLIDDPPIPLQRRKSLIERAREHQHHNMTTDSEDYEVNTVDSLPLEEKIALLEEARWFAEKEAQEWKEKAAELHAKLQEQESSSNSFHKPTLEAGNSNTSLSSRGSEDAGIVAITRTSDVFQQMRSPPKRKDSFSGSTVSMRSSLTESVRESNRRIDTMMDELEGTDQELPYLREENDILSQKNTQLERELDSRNEALNRLKNVLDNSRMKEMNIKQRIADLKQSMKGMERQMEMMEKENELLKQRQGDKLMLRLKTLLEKSRAREEAAVRRKMELQLTLDTKQKMIAVLKEENQQLTETARAATEALEKEQAEEALTIKSMDSDEEDLVSTLQDENQRLLEIQKNLEDQLHEEKDEIKRLKQQLDDYMSESSGAFTTPKGSSAPPPPSPVLATPEIVRALKFEKRNHRQKRREERAAKEQRLRDRLKLLAENSSQRSLLDAHNASESSIADFGTEQ